MTIEMNLPSSYLAWLTINRGCQLRCDWCYAKNTGFKYKMSREVFDQALRMLEDLKIREVCLIGGEPTIDPRFLEFSKILNDKAFRVSVVTNGVRFSNKEFLKETIAAGVRSVVVSLKESSAEGYILSTHRDVFEQVMCGVRNLTEYAQTGLFKTSLSVTLCGTMLDNFDRVIAAIIRSGTKKVTFDTERPIVLDGCIDYGGLTPKEMAHFLVSNKKKMDSLLDYGIEYCVYVTHPHCIFPREYIGQLMGEGRLASGCQIQRGNGIIVDEKGKILPCNHFCGSNLGSIEECKTAEGYKKWRGREDVVQFYRDVANYPSPRCSSCSQWSVCGSGCRINWLKFSEDEMLED